MVTKNVEDKDYRSSELHINKNNCDQDETLYCLNILNDNADEKVLYPFKMFYKSLPTELIVITIKFSEDIKPLESWKLNDIACDGVGAYFKDNFLFVVLKFFKIKFSPEIGNSKWGIPLQNNKWDREWGYNMDYSGFIFSFGILLKKITMSTLYHVRDGFEINKVLRNSINDREKGIFSELDSKSFLKGQN